MRIKRAAKRTARRAAAEGQTDPTMADSIPCVICGESQCTPTPVELDMIENEIKAGASREKAIEVVRERQMRPIARANVGEA